MPAVSKEEDTKKRLEKLTVKELRHQAAVSNVPLTSISAAIEKKELISLILKAGPVLDTYDVTLGAKVWTAESIKAGGGKKEKTKKDKRKKKKRSSSSSSESSSRRKKRKRSRSRKKGGNRSPSLEMIMAPPQSSTAALTGAARRAARKRAALALPSTEPACASRTASQAPSNALAIIDVVVIGSEPDKPYMPAPAEEPMKTAAQVGMEAAAALGFDVLPKAKEDLPAAPALGLRPSINPGANLPSLPSMEVLGMRSMGISSQPGARICVQYLIHTRCELGANCPEMHIQDPEEEMRVRARFKMQECNYGSTCTRQGCLFRHPGEVAEENSMLMDATMPQLSLPGTRR